MPFDLLTLPNGLRVVGERMPHYRSVSLGLWLGIGSQHELPGEAGLSHFLEHMAFKGTARRTARQIACEMDAVGGQLNAFTSKECTCFYATVVDEHLPMALDVVCDLVLHPIFDPLELEKEKGVILGEIAEAEDTPEDLVHELLMLAHFGDQSISRPILGSEEAIAAYGRDELLCYWQAMYRPQNAVLSVAGNYDWPRLVELITEQLGGWFPEGMRAHGCDTQTVKPGCVVREKDIAQANICLGFPGLPICDERNYELSLFNSVYGGAVSSRLFQSIREESGLAYTVYSDINPYTDCGMISVYAATAPELAPRVYDMILAETHKLTAGGLTHEEFDMALEQLKAGYILGGESTGARMHTNGRRMLLLNETRTEEEVISRVDAIRFEDANELMRALLSCPNSLAVVSSGAAELARSICGGGKFLSA